MMMMVTNMAILFRQAHAQFFAGVSVIVQSPPPVTPLEDLYGACSRRFVIFCTGTSEGWWALEGSLRWS